MSRKQLKNIICEAASVSDEEYNQRLLDNVKAKYDEDWVKKFIIEYCENDLKHGETSNNYESSLYWMFYSFKDILEGDSSVFPYGRISYLFRQQIYLYLKRCLESLRDQGIVAFNETTIRPDHTGDSYAYLTFYLTDDYLSKMTSDFTLDEGSYKDNEAAKKKFFEDLVINYLGEISEPIYKSELREHLWYKGQRYLKEFFGDDEDPQTDKYIDETIRLLTLQNVITCSKNGYLKLSDDYIEQSVEDFTLDESKDEVLQAMQDIQKKYDKNWIKDYIVKALLEILSHDEEASPAFWHVIRKEMIWLIMVNRINSQRGIPNVQYELSDYLDDTLLDLQDDGVIDLDIKAVHGSNRIYTVKLSDKYLSDQTKDFSLDESTNPSSFTGYDRKEVLKAVSEQYDENWIREYLIKECIFDLSNENSSTNWVSLQSEILAVMSDNRSIFVTGKIPFVIKDEIRSYLDKTLIHLAKKKIFDAVIDNNTIDRRHRIFSISLSADYLAKETNDFSLDEVRAIVKDIICESSEVDWDRFNKCISDKLVNFLDESVVVAAIVENPITFHNANSSVYMPDVRRELEIKIENEMFKNWDTTYDNIWMNDRSFMKSISAEIIQSEIHKIIEKLTIDNIIIFDEDDLYHQYAKVSPDYISSQVEDFDLNKSIDLNEPDSGELLDILNEILGDKPEEKIIKIMLELHEQNLYASAGPDGEWAVGCSNILSSIIEKAKVLYKSRHSTSGTLIYRKCEDLFKPVVTKIIIKLVDVGVLERISHYVMITDKYYKDQTTDFNLDESVEKKDKADEVFNELKTIYTQSAIENFIVDKIINADYGPSSNLEWTEFVMKDAVLKKIFYTRMKNGFHPEEIESDYFRPNRFFGQLKVKYLYLVHKYIDSIFEDMQKKNIIIRDDVYGTIELSDDYLEKSTKDFSLD